MKARFDFTIQDLIDAAERGLRRAPLVHSWRSRAALTTSVLSAVLVYLLAPGSLEMRLGLAVARQQLGIGEGGKGWRTRERKRPGRAETLEE